MFQIVCTLALEVPSVLLYLGSMHGLSPNVSLDCEPWGHMDHNGEGCECLSSDSTGAYVHDLSLAAYERDSSTIAEGSPTEGARNEDSDIRDGECVRSRGSAGPDTGHPGTVPFVSHQPGAYGRLLLAVYVRWRTGLLVLWLGLGLGFLPVSGRRRDRLGSAYDRGSFGTGTVVAVSVWCTVWKGSTSDCLAYVGEKHGGSDSVVFDKWEKLFPPWTVTQDFWQTALRPDVSGVAVDVWLLHDCRCADLPGWGISRNAGDLPSLPVSPFRSNSPDVAVAAVSDLSSGTIGVPFCRHLLHRARHHTCRL